jgi:hypothetical protein
MKERGKASLLKETVKGEECGFRKSGDGNGRNGEKPQVGGGRLGAGEIGRGEWRRQSQTRRQRKE